MASVIREAWLATAELDGVADASTRQSAFVLILESMLHTGESSAPSADARDNDPFDASFQPVEQDDLYPTPELRTDAISAYLGIEVDQVPQLYSVAQADPVLRVNADRLAPEQALAMREIVLLLLGGRTSVALDTDLDDVRCAVEQYCQGESEPVVETLQSSTEWVVMGVRGSDRKIIRLREIGVAAVRDLIQRMVSE